MKSLRIVVTGRTGSKCVRLMIGRKVLAMYALGASGHVMTCRSQEPITINGVDMSYIINMQAKP